METSVNFAASILSQALPLPQEAALLYAHGRAQDAAAALERAIAPNAEHHQDCEAWDMLFDLHRAEADWRAFEQLAARFEASFGLAAPDWLAEEETAHLPPEMQHGGSGYFDLVGVLDDEAAARLDGMRRRAAHLRRAASGLEQGHQHRGAGMPAAVADAAVPVHQRNRCSDHGRRSSRRPVAQRR